MESHILLKLRPETFFAKALCQRLMSEPLGVACPRLDAGVQSHRDQVSIHSISPQATPAHMTCSCNKITNCIKVFELMHICLLRGGRERERE